MIRLTRALLLLALLGATAVEVAAQPAVIMRGGMIQSSLGGSDSGGLDGRTGLIGAASLHLTLVSGLGVEIGGGLAQKGFVASGATVDRVKLDYLQFPAMLRFDTPAAGPFAVHVFGGPAVSLKAGCQAEIESGSATIISRCPDTGLTAIKVIDFNLFTGGGVTLDFGWQAPIMLDFVYDLGLRNLDADDGASDLQHRSWALVLGTRISLSM